MKKTRVIFIILSIIWMITVFCFSHQPSDESTRTSSFVTRKIASIIYGDTLNEEELNLKIEELDPSVRKLAHYTLYLTGGILIAAAVFTYNIDTKKKIVITQSIGSIYSITDEIHQYFIPR